MRTRLNVLLILVTLFASLGLGSSVAQAGVNQYPAEQCSGLFNPEVGNGTGVTPLEILRGGYVVRNGASDAGVSITMTPEQIVFASSPMAAQYYQPVGTSYTLTNFDAVKMVNSDNWMIPMPNNQMAANSFVVIYPQQNATGTLTVSGAATLTLPLFQGGYLITNPDTSNVLPAIINFDRNIATPQPPFVYQYYQLALDDRPDVSTTPPMAPAVKADAPPPGMTERWYLPMDYMDAHTALVIRFCGGPISNVNFLGMVVPNCYLNASVVGQQVTGRRGTTMGGYTFVVARYQNCWISAANGRWVSAWLFAPVDPTLTEVCVARPHPADQINWHPDDGVYLPNGGFVPAGAAYVRHNAAGRNSLQTLQFQDLAGGARIAGELHYWVWDVINPQTGHVVRQGDPVCRQANVDFWKNVYWGADA